MPCNTTNLLHNSQYSNLRPTQTTKSAQIQMNDAQQLFPELNLGGRAMKQQEFLVDEATSHHSCY